jgi:protein phosphatase
MNKSIIQQNIVWHGWTDRGKIRTNNEDSFLGLTFNRKEVHRLGKIGSGYFEKMDFVFAVSDGVGGEAAGEYASKIAVEKIMTLLPWGFEDKDDKKNSSAMETLESLYTEVHKALRFLGDSYEEIRGMEATLSVAWFTPGRLFFAHIGDSRIYHLPKSSRRAIQLSEDDTHVAWLLRNGKITEGEAKRHPGRKILQKALGGTHQFIAPQLGSVDYKQGDIFLLCTDGLIEGLDDSKLAGFMRKAVKQKAKENPACALVQNSLSGSGTDNTTALVIELL